MTTNNSNKKYTTDFVYTPQNNISPSQRRENPNNSKVNCCGCIPIIAIIFLSFICFGIYFIIPSQTKVLIIGLDYSEPENSISRSDTIIVSSFNPLKPYIGMLSIPRDLWVAIPNIGENRINTAHFFAESQQKDSGPLLLQQTIESNFGIDLDYYVRIKFDGFRDLVDAFGGVDIQLDKPMAGYSVGEYHLTGRKALAFVRHRQNTDDFYRMENGQFMIKELLRNMQKPKNWIKLPATYSSFKGSIDSTIPLWIYPKLLFTLLRTGVDGINNKTITREMVIPYTTPQGASVLLPDWDKINLIVKDTIGE